MPSFGGKSVGFRNASHAPLFARQALEVFPLNQGLQSFIKEACFAACQSGLSLFSSSITIQSTL